MPPERFGKYLLTDRIAQGGMAEVFRAVAEGPRGVDKTVAIKRVLPALATSEFVTMFIDEARIAASLTHVNICQVFEFGEVAGSYYLAMELVEGLDLGRLAELERQRGRRLPWALTAFVVAEVARGLAYAHDKRGKDGHQPLGIVHRDVSPQNILVSRSGEVKLADFGIAKAIGKLHKTESGAVMGKLRYMSPEQVVGEPLDGRSDLFALGVVLWELLCGRTLFDGEHPGRVAEQVKEAQVPPPSRVQPGVPAELERICLTCLERSRDRRYARASELARELSVFVSEKTPGLGRDEVGALVQELAPADAERPRTTAERQITVEAHAPTVAMSSPPGSVPRAPSDGRATPTVPDAPGAATTRPGHVAPARSRWPLGVAAVAMAPLAAALAWKLSQWSVRPSVAAVDAAPVAMVVDAASPTATATPASTLPAAERARLQAELKALPQESATRRGVAVEDYLALLSAVDGGLCASPSSDSAQPTLPADALARLQPLRLEPEARALLRYRLAAGELPPDVALPLKAFLQHRPAFSVAPPAWSMAALATSMDPGVADHWLDLLRENGALRRWRDRRDDAPAPVGGAALCDRAAVVAEYAQRAPGPRADALKRFLAAAPVEVPVEANGLRWQLMSADRDEPSATLQLHLRVTNTGAVERPLGLDAARLSGLDGAPAVDPPATTIAAGLSRELTLTFSRITDATAEATVLVLAPGAELAAWSELLR